MSLKDHRVPHQKVESSNLESVGYDPTSRTLHIEFKSGDGGMYHNVPLELYQRLLAAKSKGRFLHDVIKPRRKWEKLYGPSLK